MKIDRFRVRDLVLVFYCIGVLLFIWGNSMVPASASSADSTGFRDWLISVFPRIDQVFFLRFCINNLRKVMHFSEFFLLAIGTLSFFLHRKTFSYFRLAICLLLGPVVALTDEGIQMFTQGRVASLYDVGIDVCGYFSCVLLVLFVFFGVRFIPLQGRKGGSA